ncbi:MAG TPA: YncE family protein [Candidatus Sulfotelmatobacter sp.]|nr:YncE family protein [Candidatus Sulfotelmatobacter sp.]
MKRPTRLSLLISILMLTAVGFAQSGQYRVTKTISIPGDEGWDYVSVDSAARRVYISHGSHVVVLDADSYKVVGDIPDTLGVHGIAIAADLERGFTSNGRANTVTIFDLKTLKTLGTVKTVPNPDAIVYESASKRIFAMDGHSQATTAINAADGTIAGTLALGGRPEFAVADGKGSIYVNIEDKSELVQFDAKTLTLLHRWPMAPCEEPSGLAADWKSQRLFAGCGNKLMAVINADNGKVVATVPIGDGVDANGFDPETSFAFASTGDGNLTVAHEDGPDKYTVVATVPTKKSARTMGLDLNTHHIFLPDAEFDPPAPGERRGKMKPGSFVVLVVSRD